mgnify:CR=1 FL=1
MRFSSGKEAFPRDMPYLITPYRGLSILFRKKMNIYLLKLG